jgi:HWE histidine kinase
LLLRLRDEQQKRQLLHDQLAHRLGNTLAIVQTDLNQSLATQNEVREKINARLAALAATNDLLFKSDWQCASLRDWVRCGKREGGPCRHRPTIGAPSRCNSAALRGAVHRTTDGARIPCRLSQPNRI